MAIAISGDRSTALGVSLGSGTYLFAVAQGFGSIDGIPAAATALARLRIEALRRSGQERFRRSLVRAESACASLLTLLGRVNLDLFTRSAAHDDYVTAGCSLTAVLLAGRRAFVAHVGSTAAYLSRAGYVVALTQDDAMRDGAVHVLSRALGTQQHLDASTCTFTFDDGDTLVLSDRRMRDEEDRRRLSERLRANFSEPNDSGMLLVSYAGDDPGEAQPARAPRNLFLLTARIVTGIGAIGFLIASLLCTR